MGIDSKKAPPLPAPTETETNTTRTELSTDDFKPGDDKSSCSIPEDGTPITIATRGHKASKSQTSLLIEYFEGGKASSSGGERKPSVRVRLTPSKKSRAGDHIQVTETKGSRKASLTRRIPLDQLARESEPFDGDDANSMNSYASATEESNVSRNPIDIEIDHSHRRRRPASPLIPSIESYAAVNPSEISAIPTDSFLDGTPGGTAEFRDSYGPSAGEALAAAGAGALAGAAVMDEIKSGKSRKERAKMPERPKEKSDRKRRSKSRTSSMSERPGGDELKSPRRSSRGNQESVVSAADSSVLSSNLTHRSADAHSTRSGASKTSINNPKLLETVEDAIRRLILPELSALKREQSKRESRRGSFTSTATSVSKEEASTDRRRSTGARSDTKDRRNREARHLYGDSSPQSVSRESLSDSYHYDDIVTPKRSGDLLKAAAAGAAASKGLSLLDDDHVPSEERKHRERRRRRAESSRSRSLGRERHLEEYGEEEQPPAPPMPLMSDINASELTRTSILSANTDRPQSATEELTPVQDVARGFASPTSTPTPSRTPANIQDTLSTQHANVSHGDLTALPRGQDEYAEEYDMDEYGRKIPMDHGDEYDEDDRDLSDPEDYPVQGYDHSYFATQEVPPPLKYVPYQAGARGLSPIPSVSGYTEGGSEPQPRHSRSMHSTSDVYSAMERSPEHPRNSRSTNSLSSLARKDMSPRSSGADYRNTMYTDDSEFDRIATGQAVRGVGANPNIIDQPMGVESAVASLIDGSMLDQSVLTSGSGYGYGRDSTLSYDDQSRSYSSRGISPEKQYRDEGHELEADRQATPSARSHKQSQEFSEYEIDDHGRKVPRTKSPTASEAAITAGAVGAAAAALKAAQERKRASVEEEEQEELAEGYVPAGVFRNKSFKERTLEGHEPRNTPAHSVDRFSFEEEPRMSATGLPDMEDPMPEIGYVEETQTNPSLVEERLDGGEREQLSGRATPTQHDYAGYTQIETPQKSSGTKGRDLGLTEVAGAAAMGAAAGMAATHSYSHSQSHSHSHSREPSHDHDEWQRTSDDRKRDTLVTNPYEDASPIVNPALNENLLASRGLASPNGPSYQPASPNFGQKYDEGYMSNGPNRTPDVEPQGKALHMTRSPNLGGGEEGFYAPKDVRHLSGMSQGMASPFYDASTGQGIDRIENRDIVALMQHLMVRDAQRSARDTEIIALLMNAALEMRTSFQEMKDLIQDTGDDVIFANVENTEKLQKAINGPRPYPGNRSIQSTSQIDTLNDPATKKKNLWKRALAGLSAKGTSDLSRIEDMLMQLLGEVDVLKTQTAGPGSNGSARGASFENLQPEGHYEQDRGYEPEGNSTASHASQSGHLSLSQSRSKLASERKFSDHRISTVPEHEEEYQYDHPSPAAERAEPRLLTPRRSETQQRSGSVPLGSPPHPSASFQQPLSAENTPRTDKGKRHKSGSSSGWLPKISRWSGTTASSVGKALRAGGGKKDNRYEDYPSRSGSSLSYNEDDGYNNPAPYDEDKLHTGFSEQDLTATQQANLEPAAVPREQSMVTDDDPKYKVHRNSLNLQHPQPRPGQTERFRNALETSAQEYDIPMTPRSADWGGSVTSLNRIPPNPNTNRYSAASSGGAREPEQWTSSPTGPPRPPKEPVTSPSSARTPPRGSRISRLAKSSPLQHPSDESGYGTMTGTHGSHYTGSPKPENRNLNAALGVPARRPSGPRAMTPKSLEEEMAREERRRKRDTFGSVTSHNTDDTETF